MISKTTEYASLDFIVHVDRSIKPAREHYPEYMERLMRRDLELNGPMQYDLQEDIGMWNNDLKEKEVIVGHATYKHLQNGDTLQLCPNLQDCLAIQKKGISMFRKSFFGKMVFFWGSVVQIRDSSLHVPYLYEHNGEVVMVWLQLDNFLDFGCPALYFSKWKPLPGV